MAKDIKSLRDQDGEEVLTSSELKYILEVNKKAIEINIEVEKQNEEVISNLEEVKDFAERVEEKINSIIYEQKENKRLVLETKDLVKDNKEISEEIQKTGEETNEIIKDTLKKKIEDIEKNLFRLIIVLGSAGIGTLITIIQSYLHK